MKNTTVKTISLIAMLFVSMIGSIAGVYATMSPLGVSIVDVKVGGDSLNANQAVKTQFERDNSLDVKVLLQTDGNATVDNVEVTVFLTAGKDQVSETSKPFDLSPNTIYTKTFTLDLPARMNAEDYQLRVVITGANTPTIVREYPIHVAAVDHSIAIKEVTFSPNGEVMAGRAMTAVARLKNYGDKDESDVKVVFSIPALGVQEVDYINNIEADETDSSEEVLLRIPATTKSGTYDLEVTVYYDDYDQKTKALYEIKVKGDDYAAQAVTGNAVSPVASGKTTISVGVQAQSLARGENGVIYPLTLTNGANTAKTFTLGVSGAQWATVKVSPSNVVVMNPGETKQVYVYVAVSENTALGEHVFGIDVKSGNEVVQQISLKADVLEGSSDSAWAGVKRALQVGVILLVVLIVVLGVVIAYQRKMKGSKDNSEDEAIAQTYY